MMMRGLSCCSCHDFPRRHTYFHSQECILGSKDAVELILAHGVDVNSYLDNGGRALHLAAHHQKSDLVPFLIEKGAKICHLSPKYGTTVSAALEGLIATCPSIRPHPPTDEWYREVFPEIRALRHGFEYWLEDRSDDNKHQISCEKTVKILLGAGAEANTESRPLAPPLHLAAYIGSLEVVQLCSTQAQISIWPGDTLGQPCWQLSAVTIQKSSSCSFHEVSM